MRDLVSGKKPSGLGNGVMPHGGAGAAGTAAARKATAVPSKTPTTGRQLTFPAKLSMDDDTRFIQLVPGVSYMEIMEHVRQLYPTAGPFVLKYLDK